MDKRKQRLARLTARRIHIDGADGFIPAMEKAKTDGLEQHPSLIGIFVIPGGETPTPEERMRIAGYPQLMPYYWQQKEDDGYDKGDSSGGGNMIVARGATGAYRTLIFLKRPAEWDDEMFAGIGLCALFHELGHVDDFEKKLNLIPGTDVDLLEAEAYAHLYAIRRMLRGNYILSLQQYIHCLRTHLTDPVDSIRRSAEKVIATTEFANAVAACEQMMERNKKLYLRRRGTVNRI